MRREELPELWRTVLSELEDELEAATARAERLTRANSSLRGAVKTMKDRIFQLEADLAERSRAKKRRERP